MEKKIGKKGGEQIIKRLLVLSFREESMIKTTSKGRSARNLRLFVT